jgi:very-short-patch-repair endonuclease
MNLSMNSSAQFDDQAPGLVAVMNNRADFERVRSEHWYRIPVLSAPRQLPSSRWVAFYLTAAFGPEKWSVRYWAKIERITQAQRLTLLPDEAEHPRAHEWYHRLALGPLQARPELIFSRRRRRLVFIPSVWKKFMTALELNDLHHGSPLEDRLWAAFKQEGIDAERQWFEGTGDKLYCLDFAVFCPERNIDVECDGDTWHTNRQKAALDNVRNNFLEQSGWHVLRFSSDQINNRLSECLLDVKNTINRCGGLRPPDCPAMNRSNHPHFSGNVDVVSESSWKPALANLSELVTTLLDVRRKKERREMLFELHLTHGADAVAEVLSHMLPALSPVIRERAVWCLGELGPNIAVLEALTACLTVESGRNVRRLAYSACGKLGARALEAVILKRLEEEERQVLQYALKALGRCGSNAATEALQRILARPQADYVKEAAQEALNRCSRRK